LLPCARTVILTMHPMTARPTATMGQTGSPVVCSLERVRGFTVHTASMATSTTATILTMATEVPYRRAVPSSSTTSRAMKRGMDKATRVTLAIIRVQNMLSPDIRAEATAAAIPAVETAAGIRVAETAAAVIRVAAGEVTTKACGT
jgi:hypothetical protein